MAVILNIETATPLCSVSLNVDGKTRSIRETDEERAHASLLTPFIQEVLEESGYEMTDLQAIAVGKGPGSYTGLRIGSSVAKGLCFGASLPLIAISTLEIYCLEFLNQATEDGFAVLNPNALICPMIDARRMEVYTCLYDLSLNPVNTVSACVITPDSFSEWLGERIVFFIGSGMEKCMQIIDHPNARFVPGIKPSAKSLGVLAENAFLERKFETVAYFEPFYLKDFVATTPKKLLGVEPL